MPDGSGTCPPLAHSNFNALLGGVCLRFSSRLSAVGELPWPLHPLHPVNVTWRAQHNMEDKGQPSRLHSEAPMAGSLGPPFVVPRANLAFALLHAAGNAWVTGERSGHSPGWTLLIQS